MNNFITPRLLSEDDFTSYTTEWQKLVNGLTPEVLTASFASASDPKQVINYVYLPSDYAIELLSAVGTAAIRTKFVFVEEAAGFSIVLFGVDASGRPTSAYYLAGVADHPATVDSTSGQYEVSLDLVTPWIENWNAQTPDGINTALFDSIYGPLLGYTYPLDDFLDVLNPVQSTRATQVGTTSEARIAAENSTMALWLNFALHKYAKPGATDGETSNLFSTVLTLNTIPEKGAAITLSPGNRYYDVSKPCPPVCGPLISGLGLA